MMTETPIVNELVMVGGGHAHALVLRRWGMKPVPGARLTLISPEADAPYTGMLPGYVAGHYGRDALDIDLVRLARFAGARFIPGIATSLDPEAKRVTLTSGREIPYDILSLDIGITSEMANLKGFAEHGFPAKPLYRFANAWGRVADGEGPLPVAVLGGGVAGAELAMAAAHRLEALGRRDEVTLIDRGTILGGVSPAARMRLMAALKAWRIACVADDAPVEVTASHVTLSSGRTVPAQVTIGAAGAVPQAWLAASGLCHSDGYITVDASLRSVSHPSVYACGDCAHFAPDPRPKAGVYAVRAAPILAHNLAADLTGSQRRAFRPQRDFLKLVSLGDKRAVAEKSGYAIGGAGLWRWKDRIDVAFMERLRDLPPMAAAPVPANAAKGVAREMSGPAPCGGCGAKLGADALSGVIESLTNAGRGDVTRLPGDDAALLRVGATRQVVSTDHLRAFALDPARVARVAAVHSLGDIWAMGAVPQAALATVILSRLEARLQRPWLSEVMEAAAEVFSAAGADIVGGHSSMGAELTIGFTVTGTLDGDPVTLKGARPGDALILTKPIGSGVILAAEMQCKATGTDVLATWQAMEKSQGAAARRLAPVAHAMTDVTGFGLAGHLWNICRASGTGADVVLDDVPFLPGAEGLVARGIRSTLHAQNVATLGSVAHVPDTARGALMFDPQTAGGLLAAVPDAAAGALLADLSGEGVTAMRIGHVTDKAGEIRFT